MNHAYNPDLIDGTVPCACGHGRGWHALIGKRECLMCDCHEYRPITSDKRWLTQDILRRIISPTPQMNPCVGCNGEGLTRISGRLVIHEPCRGTGKLIKQQERT